MAMVETGTPTERPLGTLRRDLADRSLTGVVHPDGVIPRDPEGSRP